MKFMKQGIWGNQMPLSVEYKALDMRVPRLHKRVLDNLNINNSSIQINLEPITFLSC